VLSPLAARKAEKLGYKNVKVFHAGLPAWKKAGQAVVSNVAGLEGYNKTDASYVLIDLRPKNIVEKGHIAKAVALPEGGLDALKDEFPKYKGAAIILYNQHGDVAVAREAYKKIQDWGYKQVSILAGGIEAWEKAGQPVAKGAAAAKIAYVRKLADGEVELAAFKAQMEKPGADAVIVDVRGSKEATEGSLPNTMNVPLDDLEQRLSDIPKDKTVFVYCSTGARAEMAYNVLKKAGYKVKYLKAKVDFDKENKGKYTIED
jgi:rhodanese-related sulfurtransferase